MSSSSSSSPSSPSSISKKNSENNNDTSSFTATRINSTSFLIIEDDGWGERPHIYAILHPTLPVLVLADTGCDLPRRKGLTITRLRDFLETSSVKSNGDRPLNPADSTTSADGSRQRAYIIICTHCHYDHIGGIEQFSLPEPISSDDDDANDDVNENSTAVDILASAHGRKFIESNLAEHSLCKYMNIPTPLYVVTYWARDFERLKYPLKPAHMNMEASQLLPSSAVDLGITVIHTPGHTPDELAFYDHSERHLYVGDSFYEEGEEGMAIQFPTDGNWLDYLSSMAKLLKFIQKENGVAAEEDSEGWLEVPKRVKIGCGHTTTSADGESMLKDVMRLFEDIIMGKVPIQRSEELMGEVHDLWREKGQDVQFSVRAPRRLCEDARKRLQVNVIETPPPETKLAGLLRKLPFGF